MAIDIEQLRKNYHEKYVARLPSQWELAREYLALREAADALAGKVVAYGHNEIDEHGLILALAAYRKATE